MVVGLLQSFEQKRNHLKNRSSYLTSLHIPKLCHHKDFYQSKVYMKKKKKNEWMYFSKQQRVKGIEYFSHLYLFF